MEMNNLLVICEAYNTFQKDSTDIMAKYFKNISVFVKYNPIAEISRYISFPSLKPFSYKNKVNLINKPPNLDVCLTPVFYLPSDSQYKKLGEKHFNQVCKRIEKHKPQFDLIHSHFTWSSGYVGAELKEKYNIPFIVTAHGYDIYTLPFKDTEWKSKIEYVLNSADAIITVSNSNLEYIRKLDVKKPVIVVPNGYREDVFYPTDMYKSRKLLSLPFDKKIVLSIGNLVEIKGHKYLIEALTDIVKKRKDVICFIIGEGKLERKLNKQIKSAGLQEYVKLVGSKLHNDIPIWMNACDIFVLPSLRESFGVVQIEAMACGKPVVATYNGGSQEIITSEEYGFLVEPANPKLLMESILISLEKEWDSKKIKDYTRQFTWRSVSQKTLKIYGLDCPIE